LLHQWPEQKVFIDGGTDHYGEKLFAEYIQVWNLDPGWREVMDGSKSDMALIPPASRLAEELVRDQGWGQWYCDSTAVILRRPPAAAGTDTGGTPQAGPCRELGRAAR
jgi:hypothetical protein